MRIYMDPVKNQAQVQAAVHIFSSSIEPKEQALKISFLDLYFGNCV